MTKFQEMSFAVVEIRVVPASDFTYGHVGEVRGDAKSSRGQD